jgi:hypothetical protein
MSLVRKLLDLLSPSVTEPQPSSLEVSRRDGWLGIGASVTQLPMPLGADERRVYGSVR